MNRFRYLKNVVSLSFEEEKCVGCGMCAVVCPHGVFTIPNGKAAIGERDGCMECGACAMNCPAGALHVQKGVGCAAAVINAVLGRKSSSCCCVLDTTNQSSPESQKPDCC